MKEKWELQDPVVRRLNNAIHRYAADMFEKKKQQLFTE